MLMGPITSLDTISPRLLEVNTRRDSNAFALRLRSPQLTDSTRLADSRAGTNTVPTIFAGIGLLKHGVVALRDCGQVMPERWHQSGGYSCDADEGSIDGFGTSA